MRTNLMVLCAAALSLCGCSSLGVRAALSLSCPESEVVTNGLTASGCGRTDAFYSDDGQWVSLRERAAFELECNRADLEVVVLSSESFGVTGCGKRAAYRRSDIVGFAIDFNAGPGRSKPAASGATSAEPPKN